MKHGLVLLDIFSYSCMNCLRSLEFIKKINKKYKKFGLETIIVHPPEWDFEKERKNINFAFKKYNINFPIIFDKTKKIIKKLKINFWPAQILIKDGEMLYRHVGEGNYKKLECHIIKFLGLSKIKKIFHREPKYSRFPAIYCGKRKSSGLFGLKDELKFGAIYKSGKWVQKNEYLQSCGKQCSLAILTKGNIINFVAKSVNKKPIKIDVKINGKFIKKIAINKPQLYNILKMKNHKQQKLTLAANQNLAVYSFSFQ